MALSVPRTVSLSFNEPVVSAGSTVRLVRPDGRAVRLGPARARGSRSLSAPVEESLPPAVYAVRWTALGDDGHTVSGAFRFGVPRAGGRAPPGVERLGAATARGGQEARGEGAASVVARWLGLVAAGVLVAAALLRGSLADADPESRRLRRLVLVALAALAAATLYAVVAAESGGGRSSFGLVFDQPTGVLAVVRLGALLLLGGASLALPSPGARRASLGAAGVAALVTYALAGHVRALSGAPAFADSVQVLHVLAAGTWMGGLVVLVLGTRAGARPLRAFAPLAAACVGLLAATGIAVALREVDAWYFLRWSDYGRVIIAKSVLLLALAPAVALTVLAVRRGRAAGPALRVEAIGAVAIVLLASVLAGLVPGRGQALPAQRGNLLVGAAFGSAPVGSKQVRLTLAPAAPGRNVVAAAPVAARSLAVTLRCACERAPVVVRLRRTAAGAWASAVELPSPGTYFADLSLDGTPGDEPAALQVGDPPVTGSSPRRALMTADLSGPGAPRCRATAQGALLAVGRLDARGGLPGGRKLSLRLEDDGGDPARAAARVRAGAHAGNVALLAPCGAGAAGALAAARGLPAIAADPGAAPATVARSWRAAGDPRAEGVAVGRYLLDRAGPLLRSGSPRRVAALVASTPATAPATAMRLAGLRSALGSAGFELTRLPATDLGSAAALRRDLDARRFLATFLDGDPGRLAPGLRAASRGAPFRAGLLVAASPLLDEDFVLNAGAFGTSGAISAPSEVVPGSADGVAYVRQARALFPSDRPSIAGLRGYVAGLTLTEGVRDGTAPSEIAARLRRPRPFTDALVGPWRDDAPTAGGIAFAFLAPRILSPTLAPALGGHLPGGDFFDTGTWMRTTSRVYGPTQVP